MDEERIVERQSVTTPVDDVVTPVATPVATVSTNEVVASGSVVSETVRRTPSGGEVARRSLVFLFGIVQALIGIRIVLLLVDASRDNGLVKFIYDVSGIFVGPFEGVLNTNAVQAGASILDVAALVAIVGWTILEVLVIAGIGIMRREP